MLDNIFFASFEQFRRISWHVGENNTIQNMANILTINDARTKFTRISSEKYKKIVESHDMRSLTRMICIIYNISPEREGDLHSAIHVIAKGAASPDPVLLPRLVESIESILEKYDNYKEFTLSRKNLPKQAPEKWVPRGKERPDDFAVRVYGSWMMPDNTGISMAEIFNLDAPLYHALRRSRHAKRPDGFFLPSKSERLRATVRLVQDGKLPLPVDYRTRKRLATAAWRSGQTLSQNSDHALSAKK